MHQRGRMSPPLVGAIATGQSGNINGTLNYLKTQTGANAVLTGPTWTTLFVGYNNGFWMILIY